MQNYPWLKSYPAGFSWDAELPARPVFALLDEAERLYPQRVAIDFLGSKTTFAELARNARKLAAGLKHLGVGRGVKVGLLMPNCPQFVTSYYAVLYAGGTVVNYNPLYSTHEVEHQIADSATLIMITLNLNLTYPKVAACLGRTSLKHIVASALEEALPWPKRLGFKLTHYGEITSFPDDAQHTRYASLLLDMPKAAAVDITPESDVALLQYTGGTTGIPKGAVLTHANIYINTLQCGLWFTGLKKGEETIMGVLPLFHVFAMASVMNLAIHTGTTMLLLPRFDLRALLRDIAHKRPTLMPGVPTMFAAIQNFPRIGDYDLTSLKMCISGSGPLPVEIKTGFEARTGCKLIEGYGLTEASPVACANPLFGLNKAGSIGLPFPGTVMEIIDPDHPGAPLQPGEVGEICIRGPQVMQGYWQRPQETEQVLRNGRLHTGDIGFMDEGGYIFVVDRIKEMIISGGYKIYPRMMEEILYRHPAVAEAAVIGVAHPQRIQAPKVFVVLKEGMQATASDILDYLRQNIAAYAMPHEVEFRASLPKSIIGKVLKRELLEEEKSKNFR